MIGNFFKTGKTIVIDDVFEEAKPLLNWLYQNHIPHYYSDGGNNSRFPLPKGQQHFRLIFLDLNLKLQSSGGSTDDDDYKNFRAGHIAIVEKIIKNNNHSYVLIIWSKEEDKYKDQFERIFNTEEKYSTSRKPYKIIPLTKADFFRNNEWIEGKEQELSDRIVSALKELDSYKIFCEWERIVNESSAETFDSIFQTVNEYPENEKEGYLSKLLTLLSIAYSGDEGYLNLKSDQQKTDSVLLALNQVLGDDIDRMILDHREEEYENWVEINNREDIRKLRKVVDRGLINAKLFTYSPNKPELTGSLYQVDNSQIIQSIFSDSILYEKVEREVKSSSSLKIGKKASPEELQKYNSTIETEKLELVKNIFSNVIPVELNITALCDIAQGKDKLHRVIPGLLIKESDRDFFNTRLGYIKATEIFQVDELLPENSIAGNVLAYFDLRYFTTYSKENIKSRVKGNSLPSYLFTFRANLINDFQIAVANHISRPGVLYLQEK